MPRTARTPPPTPPAATTDSDDLVDTEQENITHRGKRKLVCFSPETSSQMKNAIEKMHTQLKEEMTNILTSWKSEQDVKLSKIVTEIADLKTQFVQIQKTNLEIEKNVQFVSSKYDELISKIKDIEKQRIQLQSNMDSIENKLYDIQYGPRSASVELRNVPEKDKETHNDLLKVIHSVGKALQTNIESSEIRDIYRIPGKNVGNRTILAELTTVHCKDSLIAAARNFNKAKSSSEKLHSEHLGLPGKRSPVFVAEYFPPSVRKLFYQARTFAKENKYQYCWCKGGRIFLRKENGAPHHYIKSEQSLDSLKSSD